MRPRLLRRFGHLNLDSPCGTIDEVEIPSRQGPGRLRRWMPRVYLEILLREVLDAGAVAMSFGHERTDDCLRCVFVRDDWREDPARNWYEVVPAPGPLADGVFAELRSRTRCREVGDKGTLPYRYRNTRREAAVALVREDVIGIWFTGDRPPLVVRGPGDSIECVKPPSLV